VFNDKEAKKIGAIIERDLARGEALTAFDEKGLELGRVHVEKVVAGGEEKV
jgi:hypothetical protein